MIRIPLLLLAAVSLFGFKAAAQNTGPVVTSSMPQLTVFAGGPSEPIELTSYFKDSDVTAAVRMGTVMGNMDFGLYGQQTPLTVANFLKYVNEGRYFTSDPTTTQLASSFVHRSGFSVTNTPFVIQGGGFLGTVHPQNAQYAFPTAVPTFSPIPNEPGISNKRGTIAMAKLSNNPNSATSQWFINLADNGGSPSNLDTTNGGFTVFGRVLGSGMTVADAIAALPRYNATNVFGSAFGELPLRDYDNTMGIKVPNLVSIPAISHLSPLSFSAVSNNTAVATVTVSGTRLLVQGKQVGAALITVTATDLDGATVSQSFTVNGITMPGHLANISTRLQVGTNQDVLIGGFIVRGGTSKRLLIRGLGPSLAANGQPVAGRMADPVLELHDRFGATIATNNNWAESNAQQISDTGVAPASLFESAILVTVPSNSDGIPYTAVLQGVNSTTGIGIVEVYDLDSGPGSLLVNISTRGKVGTDLNVLIGGFIITGADSKRVLIRGIGPSLAAGGVTGPLANPTIELHDGNGAQIDSNDDWQSSPQKTEIEATGVAPSDPKESAMLRLLPPAAYTAVVRGAGNTTGVGSVEVYQLQ